MAKDAAFVVEGPAGNGFGQPITSGRKLAQFLTIDISEMASVTAVNRSRTVCVSRGVTHVTRCH